MTGVQTCALPIFSLGIAKDCKSAWQIFSAVHSDNNHYLNTLYLYLVKGASYAPVYRYLSVLFGVVLVPAGYWMMERRSRVEALLFAGLLAWSYPLIHFSSEARGYSGALLGTVLACGALVRWMEKQSNDKQAFLLGVGYGLGMVLGILSHLTAILIWAPLAAGSLILLLARGGGVKAAVRWAAVNTLPAMVLLALYFLDLRYLEQLGGAPMTMAHGLGRLLALTMGWPGKDVASSLIVLVPLALICLLQVVELREAGDAMWLLMMLIYAVPVVCILLLKPAFFSPRYFLVVVPFVYVPVAMMLERLSKNRMAPATLTVVCGIFLVAQGYLYTKFLEVGRGQFSEALHFVLERTPTPLLASNQDFRAAVELSYFAPRVPGGKGIAYLTARNPGHLTPDWYIVHGEGYEEPGPATLDFPNGTRWYRAAYFGASELSGQALTIYRHGPER